MEHFEEDSMLNVPYILNEIKFSSNRKHNIFQIIHDSECGQDSGDRARPGGGGWNSFRADGATGRLLQTGQHGCPCHTPQNIAA